MAIAGLKGNISFLKGNASLSCFSFSWLLGQTLLGGPILKWEVFFIFFSWVDWLGGDCCCHRQRNCIDGVYDRRMFLCASCFLLQLPALGLTHT